MSGDVSEVVDVAGADDVVSQCAGCGGCGGGGVPSDYLDHYVREFIDKRFVAGMTPALAIIVGDIVRDAFEDGVAWCRENACK